MTNHQPNAMYEHVCEEWIAYVLQHKDAFGKEYVSVPYLQIVENIIEKVTVNERLTIMQKIKTVSNFLDADIDKLNKIDNVSLRLKEKISNRLLAHKSEPNKLGYALITFNYDDTVVKVADMKYCQERMCALPHWITCLYVHEKHRQSGIHHHTHFLVQYTLDKSMAKSKLLQYCWSMKNIKRYIKSQNFIDIKTKDGTPYDALLKYIHGEKTTAKLPLVELDASWRLENNL